MCAQHAMHVAPQKGPLYCRHCPDPAHARHRQHGALGSAALRSKAHWGEIGHVRELCRRLPVALGMCVLEFAIAVCPVSAPVHP